MLHCPLCHANRCLTLLKDEEPGWVCAHLHGDCLLVRQGYAGSCPAAAAVQLLQLGDRSLMQSATCAQLPDSLA